MDGHTSSLPQSGDQCCTGARGKSVTQDTEGSDAEVQGTAQAETVGQRNPAPWNLAHADLSPSFGG